MDYEKLWREEGFLTVLSKLASCLEIEPLDQVSRDYLLVEASRLIAAINNAPEEADDE